MNASTNAGAIDPRIADFKVLLPLPGASVLVDGSMGDVALALRPDVARVDVHANAKSNLDPLPSQPRTSDPNAPEYVEADSHQYDIVIGREPWALSSNCIREGGVACEVGPMGAPRQGEMRWLAAPAGPVFRFLVPDTPAARNAATRHFGIATPESKASPLSAMRGWLRRSSPPNAISTWGVALSSGATATPVASFAAQTLDAVGLDGGTPPERLIVWSGALGEGNPIILFVLGDDGVPLHVIKTARYRGFTHLQDEYHMVRSLDESLGAGLANRLIIPECLATVDGRAVLRYPYVPSLPFSGFQWRTRARAHYLKALGKWLAGVANKTAHVLSPEEFTRQHRAPLQRLLSRGVIPPWLAPQARQAVRTLSGLANQPISVLEHGDLWLQNTRRTSTDGREFRVLDWGSSAPHGIALGDLCYALASANAPVSLARKCIGEYMTTLEVPKTKALALWLSYMARRWEELDEIRGVPAGYDGADGSNGRESEAKADPAVEHDPYAGGGILLHPTARIVQYLS